jgi:hypothetical protein
MSRAATLLALLLVACSGEESLTRGLTEPLRIDGAQFREGPLPGGPATGDSEGQPAITLFDSPGVVAPGLLDRRISGRATPGSAAVGVRFKDIGTGYWLLRTTNADIVNNGELLWGGAATFARSPAAGKHELLAVAFDADGRPGPQTSSEVCLSPEIPDNGNACDPTQAPPKLVISLAWNTAVDLDLRVVTPSGKVVDAKRPTTAVRDDGEPLDPNAEGVGQILFDSNAGCEIDGQQRESLVFQTRPPAGSYLIYASLFEACGQDSVELSATVTSSVPAGDAFTQVETLRVSGSLQALHASSGASLGTFLTQFVIR